MNNNVMPTTPRTYRTNMINTLNQYLANIATTITNLYNYHWNVTDKLFPIIHEKTEMYYTKLQNYYDQIAERIKMLNGYPITMLEGYIQNATIKNIESRDYDSQTIIKNVISDFEILLSMTQEIGNLASRVNDMNTIDTMTEQVSFYEKQLWMLRSQLDRY